MENIKIFACPTAEEFAQKVCSHLGLPLGRMECFKFKNDNTFVKVTESVRGQEVYVIQTTVPPVNERIMELLITIETLKRAGPSKITAVLPYYMYSRSDKKDQPRVPITAKLLASMLEVAGAHSVITCDLHNSSIQGFFDINVDHLKAKNILIEYFKAKKLVDVVVVAPDEGSVKRAYRYSKELGTGLAMMDKRRDGNDDRAIASTVIGDVNGKDVFIFDDEVDTAGSLTETVMVLKKNGAKDIYFGCTHGVLSGPAIERIKNSDIKELVITDTVPLTEEKKIDKITVLSVAEMFGEVIRRNNEKHPIGELF